MTVSFEGRAVIVTGAGGGIGRCHALEIARRGGMVLVNDLGGSVAGVGESASMASIVVQEIHALGGTAVANHDSVATSKGASAMVEQALNAFGRIDALICNAGIMRNAFLVDTSDEDWDAVIATHLSGSFRMTRAVWPHMAAAGYGRIVYTASSAGLFGTEMVGGYGAAKAGVAGLMHVAALEGAPVGIRCNAIMPFASTRMTDQAGADWAKLAPDAEMTMPPEMLSAMDPAFNTPLAVYLASEECTDTRGLFSQCLGRNARVVIGTVPGWQAGRETPPGTDDIAENWQAIAARPEGLDMPNDAREEMAIVMSHCG